MKRRLACLALAAALAGPGLVGPGRAFAAENRCGWLSNPTPANWWLDDRDGSWTLMTQGSEGAEGMDLIGEFPKGQYVETNGSYGYGCACLGVETAKRDGDLVFTRITSFRALPLAKCENDKALSKPE